MDLTSRIALSGPPPESPEDFLSTALATLDPQDSLNIHGDADHGLVYTSPHLPAPIRLDLADPQGDEDRKLFSHYLWNSSLLLAELVEAGALQLDALGSGPLTIAPRAPTAGAKATGAFDITGLSLIELGAGTALPSLVAALLGAGRVVVTDYPAPAVLETLRANVKRNVIPSCAKVQPPSPVLVQGHAWGELDPSSSSPDLVVPSNYHAFDRVLAADCLWMPWQHDNLRKSISWFLGGSASARAWVVAGFHTGREKMRLFFEAGALAEEGLEMDAIWERDVEGVERPWVDSREGEDGVGDRKRWLVVAVLKRPEGYEEHGGGDR